MGTSCVTTKKKTVIQHKIIEKTYTAQEFNLMSNEQKIKLFGPDEDVQIVSEEEVFQQFNGQITKVMIQEFRGNFQENLQNDYSQQCFALPYLRLKESGVICRGQWKNKQMNGYGEIFLSKGGYYYGPLENGKASGHKGWLIHENGDKYEGGFQNNAANGFGKFIGKNGLKYEGLWQDDKRQGSGELSHKTFKYVGLFSNGIKQGKGVLQIYNQLKYDGQFENDMFSGEGILTYEDDSNRQYQGQFENNQKNGKGRFDWILGYYLGMYKNDKKHGEGKMVIIDEITVEGNFNEDQLDGSAIIKQVKLGKETKVKFEKGNLIKSDEELDQDLLKLIDFSEFNEGFY